MKNLVFHADDLGLSHSFNVGIRDCYKEGILKSTCLRTNGPAWQEAVNEILPECEGIGLGVHLNLVEGKSNRKNISKTSRLCDRDKSYKATFLNLLYGSSIKDKSLINEINLSHIVKHNLYF